MRPRRASASRFLADQEKSVAFGTGSWTDTITPSWVLQEEHVEAVFASVRDVVKQCFVREQTAMLVVWHAFRFLSLPMSSCCNL